jgi:hypothetical protein
VGQPEILKQKQIQKNPILKGNRNSNNQGHGD